MDHIWGATARAKWPIDFDRYTFIGRAVSKVGRALYGHEWTDTEPAQTKLGEFHRKPRLNTEEICHNWHLMNTVLSTEERALLPKKEFSTRPPSGFSSEVWAAALSRLTEAKRPYQRYEAVQNQLLDWFRSGAVRTGIRPYRGGEITAVPSSFWNGEDLDFRFKRGKVDENDPFAAISKPAESLSWIFVENDSLTNCIPNFFESKPPAENIAQSDLLSFAIEFNRSYPLHTFKRKVELAQAIDKAWRSDPRRDSGDLWKNVPDAMATILLNFEDRKGKAKARKRPARPGPKNRN